MTIAKKAVVWGLFAAGGTLGFSMIVKYFVYGSWLFASARR